MWSSRWTAPLTPSPSSITGVNDAAVITGSDTGGVTEDESTPLLTETGTLSVTDVDGADEAKFVAGNGAPSADALGSLTITEGGAWTYNVDNSKVQYLGEGETKVETFTVASVDGTTHTVTITITGVNDAAVITGSDTGGVTEDESTPLLTETGTLSVTDVDGADEAKFVAGNGAPSADALGSLTITKAVPGPTTSTTARCSTWARARPRSRPLWSSRWTAPLTPSPSPSPASTMPR
ncbi:VCBS domain-containing protein [Aeromonas hydrophila]|uniref:VCBS domain-containing protein n=1 Tax=Aeromonas hydrophila TaxID=644 RepID=UPI00227A0109|nr:VCBS domain-containing protein [Aeromonas hydrophila]WAG04189.1 VCBS domain-containing protein [Aeromonas hydrophila]